MLDVREGALVGHFNPHVRNVTPPGLGPEVTVLYLPFRAESCDADRFATVLSSSEIDRAARFSDVGDRLRFLERRAFRRYCAMLILGREEALCDFCLAERPAGQPYCPASPEQGWSFSSCRSAAIAAWSSEKAIGVDIEDRTEALDIGNLATEFFSRSEAELVRAAPEASRRSVFLSLWCAKEAALKSVGVGLGHGLHAFAFQLQPRLRVVKAPPKYGGPAKFQVFGLSLPDACGALVLHECP